MSEPVKAKTPYGEMSIDELASIQPGMASIMKEVGERFTETYYAAKGGNWKLAAYHLNMVRNAFKMAKMTRPKFADDLTAFDTEYLQPIFKAIQGQNFAEFDAAFRKGEAGTDFYHDKRGYPHIRYVLPDQAPSNVYRGPPEEFKRETKAEEKA